MNENQIKVYDSSSGAQIGDPGHILDRAQDIVFSTVYPGGIFDACSFFVPCDPMGDRVIKHTDRIQIKNGLTTVWEGFITSITLVVQPDRMGLDVQATGYWGLAYHRYKYNRWIDRRYQSDVEGTWYYGTSATGPAPKFEVDQVDHLFMKATETQFSYGDVLYISYKVNNSSNIKRVKFDYTFNNTSETNPVRAKKYTQIGATYSANLSNLIDGSAATTQAVALAANDLLYIGLPIDKGVGITGFRFAFSGTNVNNNAATLTLEYFTNGHTWQSITITDGTASGGACWAQDGTVTFTAIDGLHWTDVNGSQEFIYFRFGASAALDSVTIEDIYVVHAQTWAFILYDVTNAPTLLLDTSTAGSGSEDITLTTTSQWIAFGLSSDTNQEVVGNGINFEVTDLSVVAESWDGTAKTTVTGLMQDMVHYLGAPFKDDYTYIAANTYDLLSTGFVSDSLNTSLAEDMQYIGSFSATDEPYSVGVLESDAVSGSNTSAVVYYEKIPALTGYDYAVRLDEGNLSGVELVLSADLDTLYNDAYVTFTTPSGKANWASSTNYAGLTNAASITKYLSRTLIVSGEDADTAALAGPIGAVYITAKKNLAYYMRGPLQLSGLIRKSDGTSVPVSTVRAGKRIKIENFATDVGDVLSSGLTFLITSTSYDDNSGVLSVTANVSDNLSMQLARLAAKK